ncbi:related to glutaredoxin [Cephalotrichum gorgonifer]|uniref:Related to glutaredoxin n=1 Tax=Cephalotrichum gorgonifer TaxID=2041049 RepID=A0AAE8MX16_9PEZI|nr:related to glutaredoxin [Cephalotrichum gorgonifer]
MPSPRRLRFLCIALLAGVIITMLWTSQQRHSATRPLPRDLTDHSPGIDRDADGDVDIGDAAAAREMTGRLKQAELKAKDLANSKSPLKPDLPSEVIGVGSAADGQTEGDVEGGEAEGEHAAEQELRLILKKAPVIIFSKTYCPHSKKAKAVLLNKYLIEPAPHVVELDIHPQGPELQALLKEKTGRGTVPNVMVNGVSIGGGDDIAALDASGELAAKVEDLGEARKVEMRLRGPEGA